MPIVIAPERPDTTEATRLVEELEAALEPLYPRESRHGLSIAQLISEHVAFFVIRVDRAPAGCGGVKLVGTAYGELKRMYVRPQFRGLGLGALLIEHLAGYALARGVPLLRLETGIHQHEAIRLYQRAGFRQIPPFGHYQPDPLSLFLEKRLR